MKSKHIFIITTPVLLFVCSRFFTSCNQPQKQAVQQTVTADTEVIHFPAEKHLANVRQLTFGGENAEAYWSFDGTKLTLQAKNTKTGLLCDQIFLMNANDTVKTLLSTGKGRTTCSFFLPGDSLVLYASTHLSGDSCPPEPKREHGKYLWPIYPTYEIFVADLKGHIVKQLTKNNFYDAEATVSPKGDKIIFTSDRTGDLELYTMNIDGSGLKQITHSPGYDGGACFSPDGKQIVWRASHFESDSDKAEYE
ncbi:MAG TPA: hypothetical protein VG603_02910, partial [Chitinophagales bacterium]|nr:hypothetical protein [Chitinophagales bacterium]